MGRHKPRKPRRQRAAGQYSLRQLQPPGEGYEEWFQVQREDLEADIPDDASLDAESRDLLCRMLRLGPLYGYEVPMAAISLDMAIDGGKLGVIMGEDKASLVSLEEMAARFGMNAVGDSGIRESFHRLHSVGAVLVEIHDDTPFLRVVAGQPDRPGQQWIFQGSSESVNVPSVCMPDAAQGQLNVEQLGALMYMRAQKATLEEPDPEAYGLFEGVNGTEHARRLFDEVEATGLVDHRGCEACPAGHLCTRKG